MMEEWKEEAGYSSQGQGPKIPKVPSSLREQNKNCYDPDVVSIGPYHHRDPKLQKNQELKFTMARQFCRSAVEGIELLYNKVAVAAMEARKFYDEESVKEFNEEEFTQMMFVDGCFILGFIISCNFYQSEILDRHVVDSVKRDLILLENQLPFQVLIVLIQDMGYYDVEKEGLSLIDKFLWYNIRGLRPQRHPWNQVMKFLCSGIRRPHTSFPFTSQATHLIDQLRMLSIEKKHLVSHSQKKQLLYRNRPIMELKRAGINFKPSRANLFTDVEFKSSLFGGTLELPPIIINESTKTLLLNLMAYESCSSASQGTEVTSYVYFINSLIDKAEDVAELRSNGIIFNFLPDDQAVVKLFNEIANNLSPNNDDYSKVKMDIESYSNSTMKKFFAVSLKYFLAYAGATLAIILTAIQTFLAVFPPKRR